MRFYILLCLVVGRIFILVFYNLIFMDLDNRDLGDMLDHAEGQPPNVTIKVTHPVPKDTAQVDAVEVALRDMLAQRDLFPPISDSADLAGYPGLQSRANDE